MEKFAKRAFALDLAGSVCLSASMAYFFIYSLFIFPALAAVYTGDSGSAVGNIAASFGVALGAGVAAVLLAAIAVAGFILSIYAVIASFACRKLILRGGFEVHKKKYIAFQISSAILQIAVFVAACCLNTPYAAYIPVLILSALCMAFLIVGAIYKAKRLGKSAEKPSGDCAA